MFEKVAYDDQSGRDIFEWFKEINLKTRTGKRVALSAIYRLLNDTFYYGEFEYPVGSGKWYKGSYDPLIDKELFLKVKARLIRPPRRHPGTKEFDFTKMFKCGACGSGICAEEKFKHQKNGNTHRYVYYHCDKFHDRHCKEGAIREEELVRQLMEIIDRIDIDELGMREKIEKEINKYRKFSYNVLGKTTEFDNTTKEANIRNYAKYVLVNGTKDEKREILGCIKNRLEIKTKRIKIIAN